MKNKNILKKILPTTILIILCLVYFFNIIIAKNFLWEDFPIYYFPAKLYVFQSLQNWQIPLWNPNLNLGYPIIADTTASIFYPLNWLVIPFIGQDTTINYWLIELWGIFHLFLAGVFMYYLVSYLTKKYNEPTTSSTINFAALISALAFMFSGFFIGHLKHLGQITTASWLPIIFLFLHKTFKEKKIKYAILTGIFWSIAVLSGHLQIIYHISFWFGLYILWQVASEIIHKKDYFKSIFLSSIIVITIIGLTAVHIVPFLEFLQNSTRQQVNSQFSTSFSLAPIEFIANLFLPHTYGGFTQNSNYSGYGGFFWETAIYIGLITIFLISICIIHNWTKKDKLINFLIYSSLICIFLAFGSFFIIHPLFSLFLPGLDKLRAPVRFILPALFSMSILSAYGFNYFIRYLEKIANSNTNIKVFQKTIKFSILTLLGLLFFLIILKINSVIKTQNILNNLISSSLVIVTILLTIYLKIKNIIKFKSLQILLIIILFVDLFIFGWRFNNGQTKPLEYYPANKTTQFLTNKKTDSIRSINDDVLMPNSAFYYNTPILSSNHYMIIKDFYDLTQGLAENKYYWNESRDFNKLFADKNYLDLLGINYIISKRDFSKQFDEKINQYIYVNQENIPRYILSDNAHTIQDKDLVLAKLQSDYNSSKEIYLDKNFMKTNNSNNTRSEENSVEILEQRNEYIKLKINNKNKNWLLAKEIYYPGWQARVDGKAVEVFKANIAFRAIQMPLGTHIVEFEFIPKSYIIGKMITIITIIAIFIVLYLNRRTEKIKIAKTEITDIIR